MNERECYTENLEMECRSDTENVEKGQKICTDSDPMDSGSPLEINLEPESDDSPDRIHSHQKVILQLRSTNRSLKKLLKLKIERYLN